MTILHIVLSVLDWLCMPFSRASESDSETYVSPRGIWENSGVIWIEPVLDPSFRVLAVRHADGAGPPPSHEHPYPPQLSSQAPSTLIWVCPELDPSFKVHGVRPIGAGGARPSKKFEFSDSESDDDDEPASAPQTAWEPWHRLTKLETSA
ncbi:hypothetical protein CC85DRAFT_303712 [Cutaneotrichosporon oleaginosum]|uniref:Secreted protein n=1 Tax=Cutaneotrichosporon oleaginosum TaxID=879819 RepID=A0A0J0XIQ0_9TREE|nr:uncharacterized protein CC85DRAFT_303712 [Cutaneotrichosporon oleaginosum]KLT40932.1 hypothetical protein CC85DRAFT_303712 [Cutaneotrichosporon oleaginosum]TXT15425.1 hypothetical protein COLE_01618 [Cutaneotrichosporon oleaginosum]